MFNPSKQVCDWPTTVMQIRPECRYRILILTGNNLYIFVVTYKQKTMKYVCDWMVAVCTSLEETHFVKPSQSFTLVIKGLVSVIMRL
jgi:hypothetical protein